MATSALRAAHIMRSLPLSGTWKHTSRIVSISTMSQGNITRPSRQLGLNLTRENRSSAALMSIQLPRYNSTLATPPLVRDEPRAPDARTLDRIVAMFEERCQKNERVQQRDFIRTFNLFTRVTDEILKAGGADQSDAMSNVIQYSALLLRCCGNLMFEVPPKGRELLAGNVWTYLKDRKLPLDITHFNSLLRVMNENETVFDPQKILDEIKQNNLQPDRITYQRAIHQYCLQGDIAGATRLLETMKDSGVELNETTFASLILGYNKQEKPPATSEMFDLMRKNDIEPGTKSYTAALIAQGDRMARDPEGATAELKKIMELLEGDEIQFSMNDFVDLITHLGPHKNSNQVVTEFIERHIDSLYGPVTSRFRILSSLLRVNQQDYASHLFWTQTVHERAIQAGNVGSYYVRALAQHFNIPIDFVIGECEKLREKRWNPKAMHTLYFVAAEVGNLPLCRAAMKKMVQEEPMKAIYTWPLIAQAKNQDEIVKVLKEDLSPGLDTTDLVETFSNWVWPKFTDDVMKLFKLNKELKFDGNMLVASFLNYSVQENKIDEAIKFITEVPEDFVRNVASPAEAFDDDAEDAEPTATSRLQKTTERSNLIANLLNQIVDQTKDPALVTKAFNMCQIPNQQISTRSLAALVRVHLLNNNFNAALEQFLKICQEYRVTPNRAELMNHCLVNKDPESLQKIMNAVSEIYGEPNSLFDLALCCLQSNKLKQAQKIFGSPGFRVRPIRVYQACRTLARQGNIGVLENFVNLTRDMYDINQEYLYQVLIDTYDRTSNAKRALNLWNIMQEEEFQPSKKSLIMIANLLEKNNISVPFQKPKSIPDKTTTRAQRGAGA